MIHHLFNIPVISFDITDGTGAHQYVNPHFQKKKKKIEEKRKKIYKILFIRHIIHLLELKA